MKIYLDSEWLTNDEVAKKGEELIGRYGCFGCHKITGMEGMGKIGVELNGIGSKHIHLFDFGLLEKRNTQRGWTEKLRMKILERQGARGLLQN